MVSRRLVKGLSWLAFILVVAGCTSVGNQSRWEQAEIDAVLDSAFGASNGDLSQLATFFDDEVAFGLSDGELTPVQRDVVIHFLQRYMDRFSESVEPSSLVFLDRKHGPVGGGSAWVQGLLYIQGTAHDAEIRLRKLASGDWKINGLRLLFKPLLDPVRGVALVGEWSGSWWDIFGQGSGSLRFSITESSDGRLFALAEMDHPCYQRGALNVSYHPSYMEGWPLFLDLAFNAWFWADISATDTRLFGHYVIIPCEDIGFFEVTKE